MSIPGTSPTPALRLDESGPGLVLFSTDDFDRFLLTQRDAVHAARAFQSAVDHDREVVASLGKFIYDLKRWCAANPVTKAVLCPSMDEIMVVILAGDEDEQGALHDRMIALDLAAFRENALRLSWMLLRASEASGLGAFVDLSQARVVFHARPA